MASSYSAQDQAADLGIHRVHNLVLGDGRKEARVAARFSPPQMKRPVLGRGDVRIEEHQYEWETRRELERIARRHNLKADNTGYDDENTLTDKIKAWGTLKVEHTIARPDGLGTGNAHRGGPNFRPIATVFPILFSIVPILLNSLVNPVVSWPFVLCVRMHLECLRSLLVDTSPPPQAPQSRRGKRPHSGNSSTRSPLARIGPPPATSGLRIYNSSMTMGRVRAKSPVRTPARKSVVGSPRPKVVAPAAVVVPPPPAAMTGIEGTKDAGTTYADQMARTKSVIYSDHAPPKLAGTTSPTKSHVKVAMPLQHYSGGGSLCVPSHNRANDKSGSPPSSRSSAQTLEGSRWSGKLATASDPYFQNPPGSPVATPQPTKASPTVHEQPPLDPPVTSPAPTELSTPNESVESTPPTDTAPNTPASITTSTAIEIEEYLDLLEAEEEEEDRYNPDPNRLQRDLEINERVNKSLAEAETAALAREILASTGAAKPERKTVQFVSPASTPTAHEEELEGDLGQGEIMTKMVYVWNTFRDFATARSVTGFEQFVPEPRSLKEAKTATNTIPQSAARGVQLPEYIIVHGKVIKFEDIEKGDMGADRKNDGTVATTETEGTKAEMAEESKENSGAATVGDPKTVAPPPPKVELPKKESTTTVAPSPLAPPSVEVKSIKSPPKPSPLPWPPIPPNKLPESHKPLVPTVAPVVEPPKVIPALPLHPKPAVEEPLKPVATSQPVESTPVPATQPNVPSYLKPEYLKPRKDLAPANALRNVDPAKVANTWDMPNIPSVKVSMNRQGGDDAGYDAFLQGLSASNKVEEKPVVKKVIVIEQPKPVEIDVGKVAVKPLPTPVTEPISVSVADIPAPPTPVASKVSEVKLAITSPPQTPGPHSFAAIAMPHPKGPTVASPVAAPSAHRSGMPVPVPMPPTPRPPIKSPTKVSVQPAVLPVKPIVPVRPVIAPKPANWVSTPKGSATISPVVGGLMDPFLAALQPTTKKEPATPVRPKTPISGSESTDSTPKKNDSTSSGSQKGDKEQRYKPATGNFEEKEPSSPTSLSSSWTLVEKAKDVGTKEVSPPTPPALTPTPINPRKAWLPSTGDTKIQSLQSPLITAPTPAPTPVVAPIQPILPTTTSESSAKPAVPLNGRKLFTFELKVGSAIVSTPVHELDNPRAIAESFAREYNLESRLPGGKATVDKIIGYFETQFADRKAEREKRRAERREKTRSALMWDQQKS